MTNYEKIKAMSIDEMTEWLSNWCKLFSDAVYTSEKYIKFRTTEYQKIIKQWLESEEE